MGLPIPGLKSQSFQEPSFIKPSSIYSKNAVFSPTLFSHSDGKLSLLLLISKHTAVQTTVHIIYYIGAVYIIYYTGAVRHSAHYCRDQGNRLEIIELYI